MSGAVGYEELRAATVRQVAQLMAAAAITAPKPGGQLFLAGKPRPVSRPRSSVGMVVLVHNRVAPASGDHPSVERSGQCECHSE